MKVVIAPTNFSFASLNAVEYAANLSVAIGANLLLVHIVELPVTGIPITDDTYDIIESDRKTELSVLRNKLLTCTSNSLKIETYTIIGNLLRNLENICKEYQPFAVVMAVEERGLIEKLFVGTSIGDALHVLHSPVLVVPEGSRFLPPKRICLASDLKDIYDLPLEYVRQLVIQFNAQLDIVHVCQNEEEKSGYYFAGMMVKEWLRELKPTSHFIVSKDTEAAVETFVSEHEDNMLLVVPKKRGWFKSLFHKSKSNALCQHSIIPVVSLSEKSQHD